MRWMRCSIGGGCACAGGWLHGCVGTVGGDLPRVRRCNVQPRAHPLGLGNRTSHSRSVQQTMRNAPVHLWNRQLAPCEGRVRLRNHANAVQHGTHRTQQGSRLPRCKLAVTNQPTLTPRRHPTASCAAPCGPGRARTEQDRECCRTPQTKLRWRSPSPRTTRYNTSRSAPTVVAPRSCTRTNTRLRAAAQAVAIPLQVVGEHGQPAAGPRPVPI